MKRLFEVLNGIFFEISRDSPKFLEKIRKDRFDVFFIQFSSILRHEEAIRSLNEMSFEISPNSLESLTKIRKDLFHAFFTQLSSILSHEEAIGSLEFRKQESFLGFRTVSRFRRFEEPIFGVI